MKRQILLLNLLIIEHLCAPLLPKVIPLQLKWNFLRFQPVIHAASLTESVMSSLGPASSFCVQNQEVPALPQYIRDAVVFQLLHGHVQSGREISTEARARSL